MAGTVPDADQRASGNDLRLKRGDVAPYEGILVIDKEAGPTSHDVVAVLRRLLGMRRIGHCGTLDPLATGLLVVCLGRYTRLSEWLSSGTKEYLATFRLGATSDTADVQGTLVLRQGVKPPTREEIAAALKNFQGEIEQVPPAFSAVKVRGVRSYALARRQESVPLGARRVHIASIQLVDYHFPRLQVRVSCSPGTYIRALAADLGEVLGCGGLVEQLRRLRSGNLDEQDALTLSEVDGELRRHGLEKRLIPLSKALPQLPTVRLAEAQVSAFTQGKPVSWEASRGIPARGSCAVYTWEGTFVGIGEWGATEGQLRPRKVLLPTPEAGQEMGDVR